jgi:hypothetical protein
MVKWSIVSTDARHCDWQYQTHHNQKFNELMCWFFVKLNNDIAKQENRNPTNYEQLRSRGWLDLDAKFAAIMTSTTNNDDND